MKSKLLTYVFLCFYALLDASSTKASGIFPEEQSEKLQLRAPQITSDEKDQEMKKEALDQLKEIKRPQTSKEKSSKSQSTAPQITSDTSAKEKRKDSKGSQGQKRIKMPSDERDVLSSLLGAQKSFLPSFSPPRKINLEHALLLLLAEPESGDAYKKVYLAEYGIVCNINSSVNNLDKLRKRLHLDNFKKMQVIEFLLKNYIVTNPKKEIVRSVEFLTDCTLKAARESLIDEIANFKLSNICLRTATDIEARTISTIAAHDSLVVTYRFFKEVPRDSGFKLVPLKGDYVLNLNFYRHS